MKRFTKSGFILSILAIVGSGLLLAGFISQKSLVGLNNKRYVITVDPSEIRKTTEWLTENQYDVAGVNLQKGIIEVITNSDDIQKLKEAGLVGVLSVSSVTVFAPDQRFLNPTRLEEKLRTIHQNYPDLTRIVETGKTLQGRPIFALLLSTTPQENDPGLNTKPSIVFDGLHHAREIMTPEIVIDVAETILGNEQYRSILDRWNVWLVPMINPDGSNIVFTDDSMWRKNARSDASGNIHGVDINRNYSQDWNICKGSSNSKYAQDYRGPAAGSEPETQAMMNLIDNVKPAASLSYHSYSELVLYSYGCKGSYPNEKELVSQIGRELAALLPRDSGGGNYSAGTPWELLYSVDGSSMDHIYKRYGSISYTFEVNQSFQPSYNLRAPTVEKHRKAWSYFIQTISQKMVTVIVKDSRNEMVQATASLSGVGLTKGMAMPVNAAGYFFKVLNPGQYDLTIQTQDGRTATTSFQMSTSPQTITIEL